MTLRIWLSRSQPGADRQARELESGGYDVWVAPVLKIEPTGAAAPSGQQDIVIFLSEHAVTHCLSLEFCQGARVLAVGGGTAAALAECGVRVDAVPPQASSEGLLILEDLLDVDGRTILVVAGADGRRLLMDELTARGGRVSVLNPYRRVAAFSSRIPTDQIDAILAASGDGFAAVARLWFDSGGLPDVPVLVPSERVARQGDELGFSRVIRCAGASTSAWLAGLADLRADLDV